VLNIHKTRLNDPFMWFMGTNDQPGDYRQSGCAGCHVVYANDREPRHSLTYAKYGRDGQTATVDPTIANKMEPAHGGGHGGQGGGAWRLKHGKLKGGHRRTLAPRRAQGGGMPKDSPIIIGVKEKGHPIEHVFTRAITTAQCMNCHMHQPNIFLNSYLGYTMWDYESDADLLWPGPENRLIRRRARKDKYKKQKFPTAAEVHEVLDRNPEGAAPRGLWATSISCATSMTCERQGAAHPVRRLSRPWLEFPRHPEARPRGQSARRGRQHGDLRDKAIMSRQRSDASP
jgi:hypothetical protein